MGMVVGSESRSWIQTEDRRAVVGVHTTWLFTDEIKVLTRDAIVFKAETIFCSHQIEYWMYHPDLPETGGEGILSPRMGAYLDGKGKLRFITAGLPNLAELPKEFVNFSSRNPAAKSSYRGRTDGI